MKCKVSSCTKTAHGYGRLCNAHWIRQRRHGDALQPTISKTDLKSYIRFTKKHLAKSHNSERLWSKLRTAFDGLVSECEAELRYIEEKKVCIRWKREAWQAVVNVAGTTDKDHAILTMLAFGYFMKDQPRRFVSDRAAFVQCARRWRALSECHVAEYWNNAEGRVKKVFREQSPQCAVMLGSMLMEKLALYGVVIHDKIEQERAQVQELKRGILEALAVGGDQAGI